jgi:dynein heavy chain
MATPSLAAETEKSEAVRGTFTSPTKRSYPATTKFNVSDSLVGISVRHNPSEDVVEPKVYSPHKTRKGYVPRRIEVERKKRIFADIDITEELGRNGVLDHLLSVKTVKKEHTVAGMSLTLFDNTEFESRSPEFWEEAVNSTKGAGIGARAIFYIPGEKDIDKKPVLEWRPCRVTSANAAKNQFEVLYYEKPKKKANVFQKDEPLVDKLERIYICFDAEDPQGYCDRLRDAVTRQMTAASSIALNLYVDCMPVDNLKPLNSEQVNRILSNAISTNNLRQNQQGLDTSSLLLQYNMHHMRVLNQLILTHFLSKQPKDISGANPMSLDVSIFPTPAEVFPPRKLIHFETDTNFDERIKEFKFSSLWNKLEAINIMLQVQLENYNLDKPPVSFFMPPEKTMRIEEFQMNQNSTSAAIVQTITKDWTNAVTTSVRNNLKDVKKGWFNTAESNLEVYNFSKLKKFFFRINFMMQDTLRNFLYRTCADYLSTVCKFCPDEIRVLSNESVDIVNGSRFPLFTVDLMFVNPSADRPAILIFTTTPEALFDAVMLPFDHIFVALKGMWTIERNVMTKLFWAYDPLIQIPHIGEDWAAAIRGKLVASCKRALQPMHDYLATLGAFMELIGIDIVSYVKEAEAKFCPGEALNLPDLCALARKHAADAENVQHMLPSNLNLGMVLVDCKSVKILLAQKHRDIASKLFECLERKTREYAETILYEFRSMYDRLCIAPVDIESLTELRDIVAGYPLRIEQMADAIQKNDSHFALMDAAKCRMSAEQMDIRWEVFRWPGKMYAEIAKQEKNMRVLEYNFKKDMEDEQMDFKQELASLQGQVTKLKELTKLQDAQKNADKVRKLQVAINKADEQARLYNSREGLFNTPITEYAELSELTKVFEPFYDLWDCCDRWMTNKEQWTNGSFMELDPEAVESAVNGLLRNLAKAAKTFDRLNLSKCNAIAAEVRDEVDVFRPKVPLIIALRNPGMRPRHWEDLAAKTGAKIPQDKKMMTLQDLVNLGLVSQIGDIEKVAERASKEFGIETALNKMAKAWETVPLIVEPYRDTGTCILKGIDDYMTLLDEHITMTQAMAFSAFKGPFEEDINKWNGALQTISEVVDEWVQLQRNWLYLQPIFDSADINKQLPLEGKRFATVDKYWRATMTNAVKGHLAVKFCNDKPMLERFKEGNKLLEMVQKGLADYLETKRAGFSRFYFLSNEELLEILSETKDPLRVQPHLRKCFEGIKSVNFQPDQTIVGMYSPESEYVTFVNPVDPKGKNIEHWMVEVNNAMVAGVRANMYKAIVDYTMCSRTEWMQKWAAQCVLNGSQTHWTREVEQSLNENGNKGCYDYYTQLCRQLEDMVILIRGKISKLARVTVGALAVVDVHARDVQKKMADAGVSKVTDFDWMSQMRYYWEGDVTKGEGDLGVIMVSSKRRYGFEYLGNTFRLVITPLTDKCYLTLMGALQMILGGAPAGPAGTGKTETTKDLAKALAKQCVVFNCSDGKHEPALFLLSIV